ncbi:MAG TPA: helix-turn-helix domain-containing protein [Candidatus Paceibacterota bacterium]|nr:helix-turn-helix domain-containing protein [Verrucomicrobiota bacterium]HRY50323.1 helix-turn-helix domain-containing protein [Candidatus Paceibacterota bacterium]
MTPTKPTSPTQAASTKLDLALFNHSRHLVEIQEAASALKISEQHVRDLIDRGDILAVPIGDHPNPRREHLRVVRYSVEAWYLERSAARNGISIPYRETEEVSYWRAQLRQRWSELKKS